MAIKDYLDRYTPIYPLVTFRILFGILLMFSTARFAYLGWIHDQYIDPVFHFTYYGFGWVRPMGAWGMHIIVGLLFISSLGITLGYRYRLASIIAFMCFTYIELLDVSYYLNHYYFVSIMLFIFSLLPLHTSVSLDHRHGRVSGVSRIPLWMLHVVMLMIATVYFYAGIAKINDEWLMHALPLKLWLPAHDNLPLIGPLLQNTWVAYLFSWTGMLYDVFIVLFLIVPRTRVLGFISVVIFHGLTGCLFPIGVFPLVMIAASTIFFSHEWHYRILHKVCKIIDSWHIPRLISHEDRKTKLSIQLRHRIIKYILALFVVFQLVFPLRYLVYPGNVFWTEEGYRFSWRVMLMEKSGSATFYVKDGSQGREGMVFNDQFLNRHQEKQMAMQPDMILQFAHHIGEHYRQKGMHEPWVRVEAYVTLNGHPSKLLIDPSINLMEIQDTWKHKSWVLPW